MNATEFFIKQQDNEAVKLPLTEALLKAYWKAYEDMDFMCSRDLDIKGPLLREDMSLIGIRVHTRFIDCYTYTHYIHVPSMGSTWGIINHLLRVRPNKTLNGRAKMICS